MNSFLLDEDVPGPLRHAIQSHNQLGVNPLDVVSVGEPPDLPLSNPDPGNLLWAEREGRILVSRDKNSLPGHLADHLQAGHHSPGIFILRDVCSSQQVIEFLIEAAFRSDPAEWADRYEYIP